MKCFGYRKLSFTSTLNSSQTADRKEEFTQQILLWGVIKHPQEGRQIFSESAEMRYLKEQFSILKLWQCGGVFWYMNVAFVRTKVRKLTWVSQLIGNGMLYCKLFSSGDKLFYQQISKEYIHQLRMLQSFALCLAPFLFPRMWFSVVLCKQHGFLHVQIQLSDPQ